mmetsp:Transcript_72779/g.168699  ORF Transcript_72779/g.168699 Transcript_72779/m.168699 type:complete len:201 (+) Transcript_72779:176-778(+)
MCPPPLSREVPMPHLELLRDSSFGSPHLKCPFLSQEDTVSTSPTLLSLLRTAPEWQWSHAAQLMFVSLVASLSLTEMLNSASSPKTARSEALVFLPAGFVRQSSSKVPVGRADKTTVTWAPSRTPCTCKESSSWSTNVPCNSFILPVPGKRMPRAALSARPVSSGDTSTTISSPPAVCTSTVARSEVMECWGTLGGNRRA